MITIIDYGLGNMGSISNMLKRLGLTSYITSSDKDIERAEKLILPGVGAFDNGMNNLKERGLLNILNQRVLSDKVPILGICLGMQLMTKASEEGVLPGLGWFQADTKKFKFPSNAADKLRIPHMGWNTTVAAKKSMILEGLEEESKFYFVHSYHVVCENYADVLLTTVYGESFTSAIQKDNIYGVQFHPEKSHKFGMAFLKKFSEI